jgi:hypothetical protein
MENDHLPSRGQHNLLKEKFEDEFWDWTSAFHDAALESFQFNTSTQVLDVRLSFELDQDAPALTAPRAGVATYRFYGVSNLNFRTTCLSDDRFSKFCFPNNPSVDRFVIDSLANSAEQFRIEGIYGWKMIWTSPRFDLSFD